NLGGGTGTLLYDGRHILTAAHVYDSDGIGGADNAANVQFNLARGTTQLSITDPVPANNIIVNSNWAGTIVPGGFLNGTDLAIIPLIDPVTPAADRQMVAPFTAQRYNLFTGDALGRTFTMVGYGETGTGDTGERSDEVQQVDINQSWGTPSGGTFTLTFNGQ